MNRMVKIGFAAFSMIILFGVAVIVAANRVPNDEPIAGETVQAFPQLEGTNLLIESVTVPNDLSGEYRLLVIAYDDDQQIFVNKWLRPLELLNDAYPQLSGYYVPMLPQDTADAALPIIGGMTLAASGDRDRERTVVVFTDVEQFNALTAINTTDQLQLFLLDSDGQIQWRGSGNYDPDTLASLESALAALTS